MDAPARVGSSAVSSDFFIAIVIFREESEMVLAAAAAANPARAKLLQRYNALSANHAVPAAVMRLASASFDSEMGDWDKFAVHRTPLRFSLVAVECLQPCLSARTPRPRCVKGLWGPLRRSWTCRGVVCAL